MSNKSSLLIPYALLETIRENISEFNHCSTEEQAAVAALVWISSNDERSHKKYEDHFSVHHTEIITLFGKNFDAINKKLGFIKVVNHWKYDLQGESEDENYTKAYQLTAKYQNSIEIFLRQTPKPTSFIDASLRRRIKSPNAIQSKDANGVTTKIWGNIAKSQLLAMPPINTKEIEQLIKDCKSEIKLTNISDDLKRSHLTRIVNYAQRLLWLSFFDSKQPDRVPHTYVEAVSGRLYAQGGINLQNAPKIIRKAAHSGFYDYDIHNCHFEILAQLGSFIGLQLSETNEYLNSKNKIREQISSETNSRPKYIKKAILSLLYGAHLSAGYKNSLTLLLGIESAQKFIKHPKITALTSEINHARKQIVLNASKNRQGGLKNILEKTFLEKNADTSKKFAHLLQGIEAAALRACLKRSPSAILLQHDGFSSITKLDPKQLEQSIYDETKLTLHLEESKIQYSKSDLISLIY